MRLLCLDTEPGTVLYLRTAGLEVVSAQLGYRTALRDLAEAPHDFDLIVCDLLRPACFDMGKWGPYGGNDNYKCAVVPFESVTDEQLAFGTAGSGVTYAPRYQLIQSTQIERMTAPSAFGPQDVLRAISDAKIPALLFLNPEWTARLGCFPGMLGLTWELKKTRASVVTVDRLVSDLVPEISGAEYLRLPLLSAIVRGPSSHSAEGKLPERIDEFSIVTNKIGEAFGQLINCGAGSVWLLPATRNNAAIVKTFAERMGLLNGPRVVTGPDLFKKGDVDEKQVGEVEMEQPPLSSRSPGGQMKDRFEFDFALSFAGEDRNYVDQVANVLRDRGISVFYDLFSQVDLWGKDLYAHLSDVYVRQARFTIIFISKSYANKLWTSVERRAAQARAFSENEEYLLPARFDDTEIPGILPTTGYVSLSGLPPTAFAEMAIRKLVASGGTIPSGTIRRDLGAAKVLRAINPTFSTVCVRQENGTPIADAAICAIADNGTTVSTKSNKEGVGQLAFGTLRMYQLLVAHPDFQAGVFEGYDATADFEVVLGRDKGVGSIIVQGTGYIPEFEGRLNPILDTHGRTYLYAINIAINAGLQQPVNFQINETMELEDSRGAIVLVAVKFIKAQTALLQYCRVL